MPWRARIQLLGARFEFESNSRGLLRLVEAAFADLPRARPAPEAPHFRIRLRLDGKAATRTRKPPPLRALAGPGALICGIMDAENFAIVSPGERTGLIVVSPDMLRNAYHVRYELIEFAVFVLASRGQGLVPLHGACVGRSGRGLLLMGSSGAGKSTLALHCLMLGMDFLAEDAVFVRPERLTAMGIPNFVHVRPDSLHYIDDLTVAARVGQSPLIRRRSGAEKYEVDVRQLAPRRAVCALKIEGVVFLSARRSARGATLRSLAQREFTAALSAAQPYPARLPVWRSFRHHLSAARGFELCRGQHPAEAAVALRLLLD
ncbi:MAG TPA: hypothetical protein VIX87_00810 [Steroidobacteraceae bacterium]